MVFMAQIEKVLSESDESSSSAEETITEVSYYTSESESESEFETSEYYDNSTNYSLFVNNDDDQEIFHDAIESASENFIENHIDSQKDYDKYSALFDNDKQHRKQIADQEVLFDKMSVELVELDKHVRDLKNTVLEKDFKISELEESKDLRPTLYDEKVISLGYTPMFLTHSNEALEIEKFKRSRENIIEFAYDYGNMNASYVNEKIIFEDDYFQEIINPDFEKIDSSFKQTSSLKPYVPNVILEKIIIDLEDEVVNLLEKEKVNLETIESLKLKGFESSETAISESENQSENDCLVIEKECDKVENSKVITPGMFKLSVSQSVSPISMSKTSCESNNVENDESVRISPVSKMPFRKKPRDSMHVRSKSNMIKSLPRAVHKWLPKLQPLAKPIAKWFPRIVQICLWIIDSGCSKHMMGNHALLTNFVEKFLGTVRFGNNDFAVIAGYGDVVIGSMTIKKVYYVEGLVHNLFSVGQFCDKGIEVAFRKSTCFVRNEDGAYLDTFSSVRIPKQSSVIWKKKWSSNTSNVDLSSLSHSKLNKDVKRYSHKDLLSCNNSHLGATSCAYVCNNAMNVSCNSSKETAKDLWDVLERHMRGSEYVINDLKKCGYKKDNCELNYKFLNNLQPEWKQYGTLMRQTKNLMGINIDALYNILKQNQGDVNDALGYKKKDVVINSDPLALVAEKTNVNKRKEKVVVSSDSEGSGTDDFSELKKITALLVKAFNRRKFYSKPTNNNLRTSSTSHSANKKQEFVKTDDKKVKKKADEKKTRVSSFLDKRTLSFHYGATHAILDEAAFL
nr:retrovirus-related Pol polyprotein from transposon TNT 1-94 [Tanacetum cinerariifolium]